MIKTKSTKHALLTSVLALFLCFAMLLGTTFAWFTDSVTSAGNKIASGTLKVDLELLDAKSGEWSSIKNDKSALFDYENWEPGYTEVKMLKVENEGSLALKWKAKFVSENELGILAEVIDVYVRPYDVLSDEEAASVAYPTSRDLEAEGYQKVGTVKDFVNTIETTTTGRLEAGKAAYLGIALKMQESASNDYQGKTLGEFDIMILAAQLNSEIDSIDGDYDKDAKYDYVDSWDGKTADTSWYNENETEFELDTAEQLAGLSELVSDGKTFEGKTVRLASNMDFYSPEGVGGLDKAFYFTPIGKYGDTAFQGTFDGDGYTISNVYQEGWAFGNYDYSTIGLFGAVENATIKNLNVDNALYYMDGWDAGGVVGYTKGNCVFDNITVSGSTVSTNNGCGGIVGWADAGNYTFSNITIDENTVISGLWGNFDTGVGGIIGQIDEEAKASFENITVACRIDAYNDLMAHNRWTLYRYSGMLVGYVKPEQTIDNRTYPDPAANNITCKNVTVIYNDWADYHYCETGERWSRVEAGYRYAGHEVAGCTHEGSCNELFVFDQLFGGSGGVKGLPTYDGVTVIYNNR